MVKINFLHFWHAQTSVPATRAQATLSFDWLAFAVELVTLSFDWLAFAVKLVTLSFDWLAFAVKLVRWPPNKFYRECQPIKWEYYPCTRSRHGSLRVSQGRKLIFTTMEIDFYHRGNWFLTLWKLIFITVEVDFYHRGNDFYYRWKLIFTVLDFFIFIRTWNWDASQSVLTTITNAPTLPAFKRMYLPVKMNTCCKVWLQYI